MKKTQIVILVLISTFFSVKAQYSTLNAHSHNDYVNETPFRLAYNNHFGSIEADIWAVNGELFVAHSRAEIMAEKTLDLLYIQPIVKLFTENRGKAWSDNPSTFQLLIDLKTTTEPTLSILVDKLRKHPEVFDPDVNENAIRIVITGNRPVPDEFIKYPGFIYFDGILNLNYSDQQLKRVPLYSENLIKFTLWNGEGDIIEKDKIRLKYVIDSVHALNKKIRFWNAPDDKNAWGTFINMGIDYLNTDHIVNLTEFLKDRGN
jgi:alkaline phosphatase